MNINQLWFFINVAQTRSIRKAAEYCTTNPSTITSALKELNKDFFVPLYKKTHFGIELTEEGRIFYTTAQKIIFELEQCKYQFQTKNFQLNGSLQFAAVPGIMSYIMSPIFNMLMRFYPDFKATFYTFGSNQVLKEVNAQRADIGYINLSDEEFELYEEKFPDLVFKKFITCNSVLLANKCHPLAHKVTVHAKELSQYPILMYVHNDITDNPFMQKTIYHNIQFTQNENYSSELIKEYNYLAVVPYLNGKIPHDFFDIDSQVLLFPSEQFVYYVTYACHKNSSKKQLLDTYFSFSKQFYA